MTAKGAGLAALFVAASLVSARAVAFQARDAENARWMAPPESAARANPLAGRPQLAAGGRKVFAERCATCHGDDGRGGPDAPNLLGPFVQNQADGALFWKIGSGNTRGGMPAFSFLPEARRWQLVLYLREAAR